MNIINIKPKYYTEDEIVAVLKKVGYRDVTIKNNILKTNIFTSDNKIFIDREK